MSFARFSDILTMLFCAAVLVQSIRLMRAFSAVKGGALTQVVTALDQSTTHARRVLAELKDALIRCASTAPTLDQCREMAEELSVMIAIADATAERLVAASAAVNHATAAEYETGAE